MRVITSLELEEVSGGMDTVVISGSYSGTQLPSGGFGGSNVGPGGFGSSVGIGESYVNGSWTTNKAAPPIQIITESATCAAGVATLKNSPTYINLTAAASACGTAVNTIYNSINWAELGKDVSKGFIGPNGVPYKPVP